MMRVIEVNNIPADTFIQVKQLCDIYSIVLNGLDMENKVSMTSMITGIQSYVTRKELSEGCRWLDNRKIVLMGCKKNRTYTVKKDDTAECRAVCIPQNTIVKYADGETETVTHKEPCYLIMDERYETPFLVSRKIFTSAYVYMENPADVVRRIHNIGRPDTDASHKMRVIVRKPDTSETSTAEPPAPGYTGPVMYKAIARYKHGKDLIGFKILSSAGECKDLTLTGVAKLAVANKVVNLSFSSGGTNKAHFRGKGISIEDIPVIYK